MHISEKLDELADKLVVIVENLQYLRKKDEAYSGNIQELLAIALHYCNIIVTTQEIAETTDILPYRDEITKQLRFIEDFILLTEDIAGQ